MDTRVIDVLEPSRGFLMPIAALPDEKQRALEVPMELLDKAKDSVDREVGQRDGARQPHALAHGRDSKGAGHRQAIVAIPTGMERGAIGVPRCNAAWAGA